MQIPGGRFSRWRSVAGVFVAISIVVFICSLGESTYRTDWPGEPHGSCFVLLLIGWLGVLGGIWAWLANPALLGAWISVWSRRTRPLALLCSLAALGFALTFLGQKEMDVDEAGNHAKIISYGAGYWVWIASIGVMILGCTWLCIRDWLGLADIACDRHDAFQ